MAAATSPADCRRQISQAANRVLLEDGGVGKAAEQCLPHLERIGAAAFCQSHGFGHRHQRRGHDALIDQLG
jgi:hypothetical protein